MTRYDGPPASDGKGGPHPLAGVPQEALDAATEALNEGIVKDDTYYAYLDNTPDYIESVAHSVLLSALVAMRGRQGA